MNSDIVLSASGVTQKYDKLIALRDLSLNLRKGELTAIIGPNGAGKSTFLNVLAGIVRPTAGAVHLDGEPVSGLGPHALARKGLVKSYQITSLFLKLTCLENVRLALQAKRFRYDFISRRRTDGDEIDEAKELLGTLGLSSRASDKAERLSHGEQRCLEIAVALASHPKVLLMDEPTAGMSPEETAAIMKLVRRLANDKTIVIVEHKMKLVFGISERVVVLHHGELLADGTPESIQRDPAVVRVYLGG